MGIRLAAEKNRDFRAIMLFRVRLEQDATTVLSFENKNSSKLNFIFVFLNYLSHLQRIPFMEEARHGPRKLMMKKEKEYRPTF